MTAKKFAKEIMKASKRGTLQLEETYSKNKKSCHKVRIELSCYGGFRFDRLENRNKITQLFGLKNNSGDSWVCSPRKGSSTFLADVLCNYGKSYWFKIDGKRVSLENRSFYRGTCLTLTPFRTTARKRYDLVEY